LPINLAYFIQEDRELAIRIATAALAHKLRDSAMHFSAALKQPLPLHLVSLSKEYIATFSSSEEESD
jgi:hypothetical protein